MIQSMLTDYYENGERQSAEKTMVERGTSSACVTEWREGGRSKHACMDGWINVRSGPRTGSPVLAANQWQLSASRQIASMNNNNGNI